MFDISARNQNGASNKKKHGLNLDEQKMKILIICGTIFAIIFLLVYMYIVKQNANYNNIKQKKNSYLVYSKYERTNSKYAVHIPYVNIKADVIDKVNDDIDLFTGDFINSKRSSIIYEYDISGIILSLVIKITDYDTEYAPETYFRSYNINLSSLEVISDQSLLEFFKIDESRVESLIENQFRNYYQEIVEEGYYHEEECNYSCFLSYRNVDNYLLNVNYYVKNGDLIAYKPFIFTSIFGEEEYFKNKNFKFMLVETEKE